MSGVEASTNLAIAANSQSPLHPAIRCSECHGQIFGEWTGSAHARADRSPLYLAMKSQAIETTCDRCHAPLRGLAAPEDRIAEEGVTCEACHSIKEAVPARSGGRLVFDVRDSRKYGPLCGAHDQYFHKMGCSPLHTQARICGGCHLWSLARSGGEMPVFTEYEEWRQSTYAAQGIQCQSCHMPGETAEVVSAAGARFGVPHHGWLGKTGQLRQQTFRIRVSVENVSGRWRASVALTNAGAGHSVPTGLPGRQVVLRLQAMNESRRELQHLERVYGRILVDDHGSEVPFYRAQRVLTDNRIAPKETRTEFFDIDAEARQVRVQVVWRSLSTAIAAATATIPEEILLLEANASFGSPSSGGRRAPPRTVTVER